MPKLAFDNADETEINPVPSSGHLSQQRLLKQWLLIDNLAYSEVVKRCKRQFSFSTSRDAVFCWRERLEGEALAGRVMEKLLVRASELATTALHGSICWKKAMPRSGRRCWGR